jgi:hypothetical protein
VADERRERAQARRDYLIAGGMAMAAAVVGILDKGVLWGLPLWAVTAVVALAAAAYARLAYGFMRRDDGESGPTTERMRKMTLIWLILTAVLGVAVLRAPATAFREAGAAGLRARDWVAAGAGVAVVFAACTHAVRFFRGSARRRGPERGGDG